MRSIPAADLDLAYTTVSPAATVWSGTMTYHSGTLDRSLTFIGLDDSTTPVTVDEIAYGAIKGANAGYWVSDAVTFGDGYARADGTPGFEIPLSTAQQPVPVTLSAPGWFRWVFVCGQYVNPSSLEPAEGLMLGLLWFADEADAIAWTRVGGISRYAYAPAYTTIVESYATLVYSGIHPFPLRRFVVDSYTATPFTLVFKGTASVSNERFTLTEA